MGKSDYTSRFEPEDKNSFEGIVWDKPPTKKNNDDSFIQEKNGDAKNPNIIQEKNGDTSFNGDSSLIIEEKNGGGCLDEKNNLVDDQNGNLNNNTNIVRETREIPQLTDADDAAI